MSQMVIQCGLAVNFTATGDISTNKNPGCQLIGFYVNSTTSGTVVFRRGGSGGTVMDGTITPAIGWHAFPANCPNGLHVTVGGTIDATAFIVEGQC